MDESEGSFSSIKALNASDVSERKLSGDFVFVLDFFTPIWLFPRLERAATLGPCPRPWRGVVMDLSNTAT